MCCTQLISVIYGLPEQSPTLGDMEQERGHSPMFLERMFHSDTVPSPQSHYKPPDVVKCCGHSLITQPTSSPSHHPTRGASLLGKKYAALQP